MKVESATLPKGTYIAYMKLRPKTKALIDIAKPAGCSRDYPQEFFSIDAIRIYPQ